MDTLSALLTSHRQLLYKVVVPEIYGTYRQVRSALHEEILSLPTYRCHMQPE